jgi:hypothetical protein
MKPRGHRQDAWSQRAFWLQHQHQGGAPVVTRLAESQVRQDLRCTDGGVDWEANDTGAQAAMTAAASAGLRTKSEWNAR